MGEEKLSEAERAFIKRYCDVYIGFRHPKPTKANLALVNSLEERGIIERKLRMDGFVLFKTTSKGVQMMRAR